MDSDRSKDDLRLGLVQFDQAFEDKERNRATLLRLLDRREGLDLCILPEMTLTGFSMDPARTELDDGDRAFFAGLARRHATGLVYCGVEDGRNVAVLLDRRGERIASYAKRHLFGLGGESTHYRPGAESAVWIFEGWRILPAICYDLRFSYHFWEGARDLDLVVVPANWPASRREHWRTLLAARAIENQVVVAGCNRIGNDPNLAYAGDSLVVGANGRILSDAAGSEGVSECAVSRRDTAATRARFPFLADRLDGRSDPGGVTPG